MSNFKIELADVLAVYAKVVGHDSLLASGFIHSVVPTEEVPTLATQDSGVILYNPVWCQKHVLNQDMLEDVLMHELMHHVQGDSVRMDSGVYNNFHSDIAINSFLCSRLKLTGSLFRSYYPASGIQSLLRPGSQVFPVSGLEPKHVSMVKRLYQDLYVTDPSTMWRSLSVEEIGRVLEMLPKDILGTFSCGWDPTTSTVGTDPDLLNSIHGDLAAGLGGELGLNEFNFERKKAMKMKALRDFLCQNLMAKIKVHTDSNDERSWSAGRLSRKDVVDLASGFEISGFFVPEEEDSSDRDGLYMYVDVSGSEWPYLPTILGILYSTLEIERAFQFSTEVVDLDLAALRSSGGKFAVETTGGTSFDCIIEHACKNKYRRLVVVTDGCAGTSDAMKAIAVANIEKLCLVYTPHNDKKNFFHEHFKRWVTLEGII